MGYIDSTIRLRNEMTPILQNVVRSMNFVISAAHNMNNATGNAFNLASLQAAREELAQVEVSLNEAAREQEELNQEMDRGASSAGKLGTMIKGAVAAYLSFRSIKGLFDLSDEMTDIRTRINFINDGQQTTAELQEQIYQSALRSRGEYQMTLDIVGKLGMQAKAAFKNNQETIAFAENLNKLFKISGTSASGIESVMYNLTQAMGSGVLRGQDLNSVMANTPQLMQIVSDYMGVPIGQIRKMAEEGRLSADVIKNALLGATDEINEQFANMPLTFGQVAIEIKNRFIHALDPALQRLNQFANSDEFRTFVDYAIAGVEMFANAVVVAVEYSVRFANVVAEHWDLASSSIVAVAAALLALKSATVAQSTALAMMNMQLSISPIGAIATLVGVTVFLFMRWAQSVGGLGVAYQIVMDKINRSLASTHVMTVTAVNAMIRKYQEFRFGIKQVMNGVITTLSNMKVGGLTIIQDFINGAISAINTLIETVNKIPGVSIETLEMVTFATEAKTHAEAEKKQRDSELETMKQEFVEDAKQRESSLQRLKDNYYTEAAQRAFAIHDLKNKKKEEAKEQSSLGDIPSFSELQGVADTAKDIKKAAEGTRKNTDKLSDGIKVKEDDISYLKELAEMRAIQNFSFDKIQVDVSNKFGDVHETADLDGWYDSLTAGLEEAIYSATGGAATYV